MLKHLIENTLWASFWMNLRPCERESNDVILFCRWGIDVPLQHSTITIVSHMCLVSTPILSNLIYLSTSFPPISYNYIKEITVESLDQIILRESGTGPKLGYDFPFYAKGDLTQILVKCQKKHPKFWLHLLVLWGRSETTFANNPDFWPPPLPGLRIVYMGLTPPLLLRLHHSTPPPITIF